MTFEVQELGTADLSWPDVGDPSLSLVFGAHPRTVTVRPRPGYPHDLAVVKAALRECELRHPLTGSPSKLFLLGHDFTSGFNGLAMPHVLWNRPDGSEWSLNIPSATGGSPIRANGLALGIVIAGKAVPQLPAWTRYLVGHEYGHCAWYHAIRLLGWASSDKEAEREYMRIRGHAEWTDGKRWHQLAVEIIANDWRVLRGIESDFWQHEVPPPQANDAIRVWWQRAAELSKAGHPDDDHDAVAAKREVAKAAESTT